MHDIICPNCGERFLGYDVAFDMSEYVLPLLYSDTDDIDAVKQVKFKYYVDEETILQSNPHAGSEAIQCSNPGGPGLNDSTFSFLVNGKILYEYVLSKSGYSPVEFVGIFENLREAVEENDFSDVTPLHLSQISTLYYTLFDASDRLVGEISIDDENVRTAIKVLVHIYNTRDDVSADKSLDLKVAIYSSNLNGKKGYHVPDIIFVKLYGEYRQLRKCCRFCGKELPLEFGYYKMKPVVLLGSHAAGKTSYLLALLNTVMTKAPFISDGSIVATSTLNNDFNLSAFMNNIGRYRQGMAPVKTDFQNVPILNLKVRDTIYSFIDWPGEKFINGAGADTDYIYKSKRVIVHARHVLFFLPPEQIDESLPSSEENVRFNIMDLNQSLSWHMSFPNSKRFKSITYVLNKVDTLKGRSNTEAVFNLIDQKNEVDMYSGSKWQQNEFAAIDDSVRKYMGLQNPALYNILNNISVSNAAQFDKNFIPVAPYGYDAERDVSSQEDGAAERKVVHRGFLAGLPYLKILKSDNII